MCVLGVGGEAFDHYAGGVAGVLTALALIVGGGWAYLRFRTTPESRLKVTVDITAEWLELDGNPFVRAETSVCNAGGVECLLLQGYTEQDRTRIGFYALGASDALGAGPQGQIVDWLGLRPPADSASLVDRDAQLLRPTDVYKRTALLRPPDDAYAVLVTAVIYISASHRTPAFFGRKISEIVSYDYSEVVTPEPNRGK